MELKKLKKSGNYMYIGFMLLSGEQIVDNKVIVGKSASIFKDIETDVIYHVKNDEIKNHSKDKPYGNFQDKLSMFNSIFNIEVNNDVVDFIVN